VASLGGSTHDQGRHMVKSKKLYEQVLASRGGLAFRDFEYLLIAFGFQLDRTVGSHRQYVHPRVPRSLPVQPVGKDAKRYQIREFLELVEVYGLHIEE
jgi:predicted RNA binding protein YcfA (HicA-like mRNA interferase family)